MPSPFPGMDPFIESQDWAGFHAAMILAFQECLVPQLRPTYICTVQKYVFLMTDEDDIRRHFGPDVHVAVAEPGFGRSELDPVATLEPAVLTLPESLRLEQPYLVIRRADGREVVAVIELLSPWNKSRSDGLTEYLTKREEYMHSSAHFVEIDLLRGGTRLPCREPLPRGDYHAFVGRSYRRPKVLVYSWELADRLPIVPIPLQEKDGDAPLDLQVAFERVYDRAGYDYSIDYGGDVVPALTDEQSVWVDEQLAEWNAD